MKNKATLWRYMILSFLTIGTIAAFMSGALDPARVFKDPAGLLLRVARPMMRLTLFISIGLFAGQIIEGMGWTNRLSVMARPFMRWGRLSPQMAAVFTTAFFSGTASLSMLMNFYQEGRIGRREITVSVLLNTFPAFFLHLPTTFFILLSLVGRAGVVYLILTFGAALLRLGVVLTFTHFVFPPTRADQGQRRVERRRWKEVLRETGVKFSARLGRTLRVVLPVYLTVAAVSDTGFFTWLRGFLASGFSSVFVPVEALSVVVFSLVAEFTSGYAAAGAMLEAGTLTVFQTVLALLIGNVIAAPVRALRHQMPYYMGIFNPGLGLRLMTASQIFRISSLLIVGLIYFFIMTALR